MASTVDQKTYLLNKYLKGPSGDKKRKKKKKNVKGTGLRIIDDDVDTSLMRPLDGEELEALGLEDEDAPQVAGIVDERPEDVRKMEQFGQGSKWRVISQNDGIDSKIRVEEIKRNITKVDEESNPIFGKMYSESEDEKKNDSDLSPQRKNASNSNKSSGNKEKSKKKEIHRGSDSDLSPPRSRNRKKSTDSDQSPPRRTKQVDKVKSVDRKREENKRDSPNRKKRNHSSDSDLSPPRKKEYDKSRDIPRKPSRWGTFGPEEPLKKKDRKSEDSDLSPPRKFSTKHSVSPQRQKEVKSKWEHSEDSDLSPPRKSKKPSPPSQKRNDSHIPQKSRKAPKSDHSVDLSPPRRSRNEQSRSNRSPENASSTRVADERLNSRNRSKDVTERDRERHNDRRRKSDSPPPTNKKMAKTLEGKMAGLQDARHMREENADFRRREDELYSNMSADVSGRNATAVNRRLGKRETSADREKKRADQEKQKEMEAKYDKWGKGLKQVSDQTARVEDYLHEASKPLARHRDDVDLERSLKALERAGDPMLEYMRGKKTERSDAPERPTYKGNWPPNRFNIRPGYRWDGVDRSNGYEKKYFDHKSKAKALAEEAYKWSTEDL